MKIISDSKIPFLKGRIEHLGKVEYLSPGDINKNSVKDADLLIVRTRTRCNESLLKDSSVRFIFTATIGTDHIDLDWCKAHGIRVENASGCNAPGVAQYVWSAILHNGFRPEGKTIGVVGHGNIGSIVAHWGMELGCRVLVNDPPKERRGEGSSEYVSLEKLLRESDVVTVHTPLTYNGEFPTYRLIGEREIEMMKQEAILVNAARGGIVEETGWIKALERRKIKGIADCWENEPEINRKLLENVTIGTPHIAGYSLEGKMRAANMAVEAAERIAHLRADVRKQEKEEKKEERKEKHISAEKIIDSYNPFVDDRKLRENPEEFEKLREKYNYRHEVLCDI